MRTVTVNLNFKCDLCGETSDVSISVNDSKTFTVPPSWLLLTVDSSHEMPSEAPDHLSGMFKAVSEAFGISQNVHTKLHICPNCQTGILFDKIDEKLSQEVGGDIPPDLLSGFGGP